MSGTSSTTETAINDAASVAEAVVSVAFPGLGAFVSLFEQGLPIAESLYNDFQAWVGNVQANVQVTASQIATDTAALVTANQAVQNAKPAA